MLRLSGAPQGGKLALPDGADLDAAIDKAMEIHRRSERNKYRSVIHDLLSRHFGQESVYA